MVKLILLCGVQGSGKTTYARTHKEELNAEIVSTDGIRKMFPEMPESGVFPKAYEMSAEYLNKGINVIFDATNINEDMRKTNIDAVMALVNVRVHKAAYYFVNNVKTLTERVRKRNAMEGELYLPLEVVAAYSEKYTHPSLEEGFDEVKLIENL